MGTLTMATIRMSQPWEDPRTGVLYFRKKIPTRFRSVSGRSSEIIKISLGTSDRKRIAKPWAAALTRWVELEAEWERRLNVVAVTPPKAQEMAARWAAWIAADPDRLDRAGESWSIFDDSNDGRLFNDVLATLSRAVQRNAAPEERREQRLAVHAGEAESLSGITVSEETRAALMTEMLPVVRAAYHQAELRASGIVHGIGKRWEPLEAVRATLPEVPDAPLRKPVAPAVSLDNLFDGWKATAVVKPRTVTETRYVLNLLIGHLGHRDASVTTRDDLAAWRDAFKAAGLTNNTWNNRLSLVRQVFEWGYKERRLPSNIADADLRLRKSKAAVRLPYSDEDTVKILQAARKESKAALRWAPWIMAFSGMRVGEVLQLSASDLRQEGETWFMAVHEDDAGKSVKTGQRRNVPIHSVLIAEGLVAYAQSLPEGSPLFPEKEPDWDWD